MSKFIKDMLGIQTPEEQVRKWRQCIRKQERVLDRQIRGIEVEEQKVKRSLKEAGKKGKNRAICMTLAKEVVRSRKAKERMYTSKATLNSISMQLNQQLATIKIAGTLQKSTEIMRGVNSLMKLPQFHGEMQAMAQEMTKAGIMEEMIEDAISGLDDEDIEEEADEEVAKVLHELTDGLLLQGGVVGAELAAPTAEEQGEQDPELLSRLDALRVVSS